MLEAFAMPFMQRALVGGILVGLLASFYGVFVVQRGLGFMGAGLAHAAFGGVALGLLLGIEPLWVALPFTMAVAAGIVAVTERSDLRGDTAIGIFFSVSMALGIIFLSMRRGATADAFTYLFGSLLAISTRDLAMMGAVGLGTVALGPWWSRWAYATFDRELAEVDRLRPARDDTILAMALAATIVCAIKIAGIVLIAAFLVIPAAAARLLARTFFVMTLISMLIGMVSVVAGLVAAYAADLPTGPCVILIQAGIFFVALLAGSRRG